MREVLDAGGDVALGQLGQIEPGAEMLAGAVDHDGVDAVGQRAKNASMPRTVRVVERVALVRRAQPQNGDVALPLGRAAGRQLGVRMTSWPAFWPFWTALPCPTRCGVWWNGSSGLRGSCPGRSAAR